MMPNGILEILKRVNVKWLGVGFIVVVFVIGFWMNTSRTAAVKANPKPPKKDETKFTLATGDMAYTQEEITNRREILKLQQAREQDQQKISALEKQLARRNQQIEQTMQSMQTGLGPKQVVALIQSQIKMDRQSQAAQGITQAQQNGGYTDRAVSLEPQIIAPEVEPEPYVPELPDTPEYADVVIPANSKVEIITLDGDAAIANGQSDVRTVGRLVGRVETPNGGFVPLDGCHVGLRATMDMGAEIIARIPYYGLLLSCVLPDGREIDEEVDGETAGRDNIDGVHAQVFRNEQEVFKRFVGAAIPQVIAQLIETTETVTTVGPLGTVSQATDPVRDFTGKVSDYILEGARAFMHPLIYAAPGQKGYFTFYKPVVLEGVKVRDLAWSGGGGLDAFN